MFSLVNYWHRYCKITHEFKYLSYGNLRKNSRNIKRFNRDQ